MGSLDQLIEENVPVDNEEKLVNEVSDTMDDKSKTHTDITVYHNVDGVHEYPNVSEEMLKIRNHIDILVSKESFYNQLKETNVINRSYALEINTILENKLDSSLSLKSFTELPTQVNVKNTLRIMLEDMNSDKEKIKNEVIDTLDTFEKTYDLLSSTGTDLIDTINQQVSNIDELITRQVLSSHPNRILYQDNKELDYGNSPLKDILSNEEFTKLTQYLNKDLALFIYQINNDELPTANIGDNPVNTDTFIDSLSMHSFEIFYQKNTLDSALAILNSYIHAAKDIIDECKKITEEYQFQYLMTKLENVNSTIMNLRYTKNVLENLPSLNVWFMNKYKSYQSLL